LVWTIFSLTVKFCFGQAEILAKFKPNLDTSNLVTNIRNVEKTIKDCLHYFNSTLHMILYHEDVVANSNVRNTFRWPKGG
jgi:hypothetical protein